jgi:uncharacterized protein
MVSANRFNQEVSDIVAQLIHLYKPQKIILFGSLANGQITDGTDIDLFVVKSDTPELGVDRIRELDGMIKYTLATDFVVYRPEEVEQRLKMGDPFIRGILQEGKVLYDAA